VTLTIVPQKDSSNWEANIASGAAVVRETISADKSGRIVDTGFAISRGAWLNQYRRFRRCTALLIQLKVGQAFQELFFSRLLLSCRRRR
jgi:hypothetical protein